MGISIYAFTDTGLQRSHNEDAILVDGWICQTADGSLVTMEFADAATLVCAVADGMGGHAGGGLASRVALRAIAESASRWHTAANIAASLNQVSARVYQVGCENIEVRGLGTTIAGVSIRDTGVIVFNVGDSRVYRLTSGRLEQVSVDDAVLDAAGNPTNVITQCLGHPDPVHPHLKTHRREGATYLICSDGVSSVMTPAELRAATLKPSLLDCANRIITATRDNGADDNFSFVLVDDVPAVSEPSP